MNCRNINLILTTWNLPLLLCNWYGRVDGVILGETGVQDRSPPLPLAGRGRSRAGLDKNQLAIRHHGPYLDAEDVGALGGGGGGDRHQEHFLLAVVTRKGGRMSDILECCQTNFVPISGSEETADINRAKLRAASPGLISVSG